MFVLRIDRTRETQQSLADVLAWTRNPESRASWPGAHNIRSGRHDTVFYYDVALPGSKEGSPLIIEEHLRPVEKIDDGFEFESGFLLTWPWSPGEVASGWSTYQLIDIDDRRSVTYSLRYMVPGKTGERLRQRGKFAPMMEEAVDKYVTGLLSADRIAGHA